MAYKISAQLVLQAPTNLAQVAAQIGRGLSGVNVPINATLSPQAAAQLAALRQAGGSATQANAQLNTLNRTTQQTARNMLAVNTAMTATNRSLGQTGQLTRQATGYFSRLGETAQLATQRFIAFAAGAGTFVAVVSSIRSAATAAVDFEKSMNKISQVTNESESAVTGIASAIGQVANQYGVSSNEMAKAALVLAQAGISAKDTAESMKVLGAAAAAPNFQSMAQTAEGYIAVMRQFRLDTEGVTQAIGAMDAVSAKFAVEAGDLVTAVQKSGGAFAAAGGNVNEFLGLFTSVRATTRESAAEIGSAFKTILARVQRADVLEQLKAFQVELRYTADEAKSLGDINLTGQFVGPMEAFRRLSQATKGLQGGDPRFASIVDSLGGYRQISRVIPLLQQFAQAEKAVGVAGAGSTSLFTNAEKSTETLAAKLGQTKESFLQLFRTVTESGAFKAFAEGALGVAQALGTVLEYAKPLLPLLLSMGAISLGRVVAGWVGGAATSTAFASGKSRPFGANQGGQIPARVGYNTGGMVGFGVVPGVGSSDTVPADLPAGSFVIKQSSSRRIGYDALHGLAGRQGFNSGGNVGSVPAALTPGEFVFSPGQAQRIGPDNLQRLNGGGQPHLLRMPLTRILNGGVSFVGGGNFQQAEIDSLMGEDVTSPIDLPGRITQVRPRTRGERLGVRRYTQQGDTLVNSFLRTGEVPQHPDYPGLTREELEEYVRLLDGAMGAGVVESGRPLYRGLRDTDFLRRALGLDPQSKSAVGLDFSDPGYLSTSSNLDVAADFADIGGTLLEIIPRVGKNALSLHRPTASFHQEDEVMLPRAQKFSIVGHRKVRQVGTFGVTLSTIIAEQLASGGPVRRFEAGGPVNETKVRDYLRSIGKKFDFDAAQYDHLAPLLQDLRPGNLGAAVLSPGSVARLELSPQIGPLDSNAGRYAPAHELGHILDYLTANVRTSGADGSVAVARHPLVQDMLRGHRSATTGTVMKWKRGEFGRGLKPGGLDYLLSPAELFADAFAYSTTGVTRFVNEFHGDESVDNPGLAKLLASTRGKFHQNVLPLIRAAVGPYREDAQYADGGPVRRFEEGGPASPSGWGSIGGTPESLNEDAVRKFLRKIGQDFDIDAAQYRPGLSFTGVMGEFAKQSPRAATARGAYNLESQYDTAGRMGLAPFVVSQFASRDPQELLASQYTAAHELGHSLDFATMDLVNGVRSPVMGEIAQAHRGVSRLLLGAGKQRLAAAGVGTDHIDERYILSNEELLADAFGLAVTGETRFFPTLGAAELDPKLAERLGGVRQMMLGQGLDFLRGRLGGYDRRRQYAGGGRVGLNDGGFSSAVLVGGLDSSILGAPQITPGAHTPDLPSILHHRPPAQPLQRYKKSERATFDSLFSPIVNNPSSDGRQSHTERLARLSLTPEVLSRIPAGSSFLGAGIAGMAFQTPDGDVIRVQARRAFNAAMQDMPHLNPRVLSPTRPMIDSVLQPTASEMVGRGKKSVFMERLPFAQSTYGLLSTEEQIAAIEQLDRQSRKQGYSFVDNHEGNFGLVNGVPYIIDPGAVMPTGRTPASLTHDDMNLTLAALGAAGDADYTRKRYAMQTGEAGRRMRFATGGLSLSALRKFARQEVQLAGGGQLLGQENGSAFLIGELPAIVHRQTEGMNIPRKMLSLITGGVNVVDDDKFDSVIEWLERRGDHPLAPESRRGLSRLRSNDYPPASWLENGHIGHFGVMDNATRRLILRGLPADDDRFGETAGQVRATEFNDRELGPTRPGVETDEVLHSLLLQAVDRSVDPRISMSHLTEGTNWGGGPSGGQFGSISNVLLRHFGEPALTGTSALYGFSPGDYDEYGLVAGDHTPSSVLDDILSDHFTFRSAGSASAEMMNDWPYYQRLLTRTARERYEAGTLPDNRGVVAGSRILRAQDEALTRMLGEPIRLAGGGQLNLNLQQYTSENLRQLQSLADHHGLPLNLGSMLGGVVFTHSGTLSVGSEDYSYLDADEEASSGLFPIHETNRNPQSLLRRAATSYIDNLVYGDLASDEVSSLLSRFASARPTESSLHRYYPKLKTREVTGGLFSTLFPHHADAFGHAPLEDVDASHLADFAMLADILQDSPPLQPPPISARAIGLVRNNAARGESIDLLQVTGGVPDFSRSRRHAAGGIHPRDTVPALLTPGEYVFSPEAVQGIGLNRMHYMNRFGQLPPDSNGKVRGYNRGGYVQQFADGSDDGPVKQYLQPQGLLKMSDPKEMERILQMMMGAIGNLSGPGFDPEDAAMDALTKVMQEVKSGEYDPSKMKKVASEEKRFEAYLRSKARFVARERLRERKTVEMPTDGTGREMDFENQVRDGSDVSISDPAEIAMAREREQAQQAARQRLNVVSRRLTSRGGDDGLDFGQVMGMSDKDRRALLKAPEIKQRLRDAAEQAGVNPKREGSLLYKDLMAVEGQDALPESELVELAAIKPRKRKTTKAELDAATSGQMEGEDVSARLANQGGDTSEKAKGLLARMRQKRAGNAPTQQAAQAEKEIVAAQQEVVQDVVKETVKRTVQAVKEVGKQKSAARLEVEASRPAGANLPRVGVRGRRGRWRGLAEPVDILGGAERPGKIENFFDDEGRPFGSPSDSDRTVSRFNTDEDERRGLVQPANALAGRSPLKLARRPKDAPEEQAVAQVAPVTRPALPTRSAELRGKMEEERAERLALVKREVAASQSTVQIPISDQVRVLREVGQELADLPEDSLSTRQRAQLDRAWKLDARRRQAKKKAPALPPILLNGDEPLPAATPGEQVLRALNAGSGAMTPVNRRVAQAQGTYGEKVGPVPPRRRIPLPVVDADPPEVDSPARAGGGGNGRIPPVVVSASSPEEPDPERASVRIEMMQRVNPVKRESGGAQRRQQLKDELRRREREQYERRESEGELLAPSGGVAGGHLESLLGGAENEVAALRPQPPKLAGATAAQAVGRARRVRSRGKATVVSGRRNLELEELLFRQSFEALYLPDDGAEADVVPGHDPSGLIDNPTARMGRKPATNAPLREPAEDEKKVATPTSGGGGRKKPPRPPVPPTPPVPPEEPDPSDIAGAKERERLRQMRRAGRRRSGRSPSPGTEATPPIYQMLPENASNPRPRSSGSNRTPAQTGPVLNLAPGQQPLPGVPGQTPVPIFGMLPPGASNPAAANQNPSPVPLGPPPPTFPLAPGQAPIPGVPQPRNYRSYEELLEKRTRDIADKEEARLRARNGGQLSKQTLAKTRAKARARAQAQLDDEINTSQANLQRTRFPGLSRPEADRMGQEQADEVIQKELEVKAQNEAQQRQWEKDEARRQAKNQRRAAQGKRLLPPVPPPSPQAAPREFEVDAQGTVMGTRQEIDEAAKSGQSPPGPGVGGWYGLRKWGRKVWGQVGDAYQRSQEWGARTGASQAIFGAQLALPAAGGIVGSFAGDAETAARSGNEGYYKATNSVSGGLIGAGTGAAIGNAVFGPVGAAWGAGIGAIAGIVSSWKEAANALRSAKLELALGHFSDRLQVLASVGSGLAPAKYRTEAVGYLDDFRRTNIEQAYANSGIIMSSSSALYAGVDKGQRQNMAQLLAPMSQYLQTEVTRLVRDGGGREWTAQKTLDVGSQDPFFQRLIEEIARLKQISTKQVRDELAPMVVSTQNRLRVEEVQKTAAGQEVGRVSAFGQLSRNVDAAAAALSSLRAASQALSEQFEGQFAAASKVEVNTDALSRLSSNDPGAMRLLGTVENLGPEGASLAGMGRTVGRARGELSAALGEVARNTFQETDEGVQDFVSQVQGQLRGRLGDSGDARRVISSVIASLNDKMTGERRLAGVLNDISLDSSGLTESLLSRAANPVQQFGKQIIEQLSGNSNDYVERRAVSRRMTQGIGEGRDRIAESELGLRRLGAEAEGERTLRRQSAAADIGIDELLRPSQRRAERLATEGGLGAEDAFNPERIARELGKVQGRIIQGERAQKDAFLRGDPSGAAFKSAADDLDRLRGQANSLATALKNLGDASQRVAAVQEKLGQIRTDRDARLAVGERYIGMDYGQKAEFNRGLILARQSYGRGNVDGLMPQDAALALGTLRQLGNAKLTGFSDKPITGNEVADQLVSGSAGGTYGLDPGRKGEMESLLQKLLQEQSTAITAQKAGVDLQVSAQKEFMLGLERMQQAFFSGLRQLLTRDQIRALKAEESSVSVGIGQRKPLQDAQKLLQGVGVADDQQLTLLQAGRGDFEEYVKLRRVSTDREGRREAALARVRKQDAFVREAIEKRGVKEDGPQAADLFLRRGGLFGNDTDRDLDLETLTADLSLAEKARVKDLYIPHAGGNFGQRVGSLTGAILQATEGKPDHTAQIKEDVYKERIRVRLPDLKLDELADLEIKRPGSVTGALDKFTASGTTFKQLDDAIVKANRSLEVLAQKIQVLEQVSNNFANPTQPGALAQQLVDVAGQAGAALRQPAVAGRQVLDAVGQFLPGRPEFRAAGGIAGVHPGSPRGTDTIPAWLTPSEFVINEKSSRANRGLLERINNARGPVHLANGGSPLAGANWLGLLGTAWASRRGDPLGDVLGEASRQNLLPQTAPRPLFRDRSDDEILAERERRNRLADQVNQMRPPTEEEMRRRRLADGLERPAQPELPWAEDERLRRRAEREGMARAQARLGQPTGPFVEVAGEREMRLRGGLDPFSESGLAMRTGAGFNWQQFGRQQNRRSADNLLQRQMLAQSQNPFAAFGLGKAGIGSQTASMERSLVGRQEAETVALRRNLTGYWATQGVQAQNLMGPQWVSFRNESSDLQSRIPSYFQRFMQGRGYADGGIVPSYLAVGGIAGPDNVPIYAQAGEYILPRRTVDRVGAAALDGLRSGSAGITAPAGATASGLNPEVAKAIEASSRSMEASMKMFSASVGTLQAAIMSFSASSGELAKALAGFEGRLQVSGTQNVNVNLNGAQTITAIMPDLLKLVNNAVKAELGRVFKQALPDVQLPE